MANKALIALGAVGAGLAAYFLLSPSEAAAAEAAAPPKGGTGPKPATPVPTAPTAGIKAECLPAFNRWSALASRALVLCREASDATDVWWQWEELRLAGSSSYDPVAHERARARWQEAQDNCNDINSDSLAAMAEYERCANG